LPDTDGGPAKARQRGWLMYALVVGLVLTMLLGAFVHVRQRKKKAQAPAQAPIPGGSASQKAVLAPIGAACSGCGKKLRVRAELIGKKVKCPHCATSLRAPTSK